MKKQKDNIDFLAREKFQERIKKGMIGPGSDIWGLPDEEEIISNDTPLQRYFSGILFPEKNRVSTIDEEDQAEIQSNTEIDDYESVSNDIDEENIKEEQDSSQEESKSNNEKDPDKISKTNFFPTNIGLSVCIPKNIEELKVTFSFGLYYQPNNKDIKIKISEQGYRSFLEEKHIPYSLPFKDILKYKNGFMFLERPLKGFTGGKKQRSEEYKQFDEFRKGDNLKNSSAQYFIDKLEKLISQNRIWKRKDFQIEKNINIRSTDEPIALEFEYEQNKTTSIGYNIKVIEQGEKKFVKIQLVNLSDSHPQNRFSNKNENLNKKSVFQAEIKVESENFIPFENTTSRDKDFQDQEAQELYFSYRKIKNYSIGHNCSSMWNDNHSIIKTTFLPVQDINNVTNTFSTKDELLNSALDIKNLTVWGIDNDNLISNLKYFIEDYSKWISKQIESNQKESKPKEEIGDRIINRQKQNLERLEKNIKILENDAKTLQAFRLANTAMYIQLITSNDRDFANKEKSLQEASTENLNNIDFFKNYDAIKRVAKNKINFIPAYRPFQLAFLLLNIEGIVNPESKSRKEIVDLIWFPTGGGKTEAYLAVAALTIIHRRMNNQSGYEGTSVIMRYTLRLLTTQQFERASRLITALDFLRKQDAFKGILKEEPITIGLWVGMGSTPNSLKKAKNQIKKIEDECNKTNGDPKSKNNFQISSCPWCGTELITQKKTKSGKLQWVNGFSFSRQNGFKIKCNNKACTCSNSVPVQVIDEDLYDKPPTLLFGTVDKFAILAWQENAHNLFNSLNDEGLPPDLIIQDELHLLNGPLGSITGFFESVIEDLSTKGNISPKIIASTATTRNTQFQVENLYGNRTVNIFPPSGISYDDNYFAKESNLSNRRYIGFMPTGKTSIDTQLQLLAHLLVARLEVYTDKNTKEAIDKYWTIVSYYNSLKDVGKIFNKVGDEISTFTSTLQHRLNTDFVGDFKDYTFNHFGLANRTQELTSRIESTKIKSVLNRVEKEFNENKISRSKKGYTYLKDVIDFVLATNMISVGIDISRLNIMLINGMPKNIAEYIQASSRIGRNTKGLAISLLNPNRAREKSYFEHFNNFHQAFYKNVEPLSITPFTDNTIDKMLASLMVTYVRNKLPGRTKNKDVVNFQKEDIEGLKNIIKNRFSNHLLELNWFEKKIDNLAYDWVSRIQETGIETYKELLKKPSEQNENEDWVLMQSMREIDSSTFINIKETF